MLTEYEQHYAMPDAVVDSVCSSSNMASPDAGFLYPAVEAEAGMGCRWAPVQQEPADDAYTLTVLSDAGGQPAEPPPPYLPPMGMTAMTPMASAGGWGAEPWQQHGPAHAGNPFEDDAVSGSDGSSPDRRCVRSLLHVALAKGSTFAQQYTSCGVPSLSSLPPLQPLQPPPCYPGVVKQEPGSPSPAMFVSSTSCGSPRPATPADSLRSCYSPASSSSPYAHLLPPPAAMQCDEAVVSTTSSYGVGPSPGPQGVFSPAPPPSYTAFRTPYPTPSPDPCYPVRPEPYPASLVPLPVHLMSHMPAAGPATPATPTSRTAAKRRRNRKPPADGSAPPPRKRERSERQLHPCTLCDKRFKDNYSVNVHMRTHTGEKPFPCIVCGKMFRQKAHLAKHRSTHQPEQWAAAAAAHHASSASTMTASMTGALAMPGEELAVDSNSNNLAVPLWVDRLDKCKAPNVWTPSILSPPLSALSSVQ